MATKIVTKNSSTASAVPTASDLVQGELAVNVADKRLFTEDNAGAIVELGTNPSALTVTGNVGIGRVPDYPLDISGDRARIAGGTTTTFAGLEVENSNGFGTLFGTGGSGRTDLLDNRGFISSQSATSGLALGTEGADPVIFYTNGTTSERMRIDSAGRVGIGTSSPQDEIHIEANYPQIRIASDLNTIGSNNLTSTVDGYGTDGIAWRVGRAFGSGDLQIVNHRASATTFDNGGAEHMRIDSSGLVSIKNTTAPTLRIENTDTSITTNDVVGQIDFYANDSSTGGTGQKATIQAIAQNGSGTSVGLIFGTSSFPNTTATEHMRIDSSGSVGIGTSSPATGLHLEHSNAGATSGTIRIQDKDSQQDANQQTGGIEFYTQDATNPTEGVSTAIKSFSASSAGGAYLTLSTTDVSTSTLDERLRIDSSGSLLVGKTYTATGNAGQEFRAGGYTAFTRSGGNPLELNRLTNDGTIVNFSKDGTTVGSIGSYSNSYLYIGSTGGVDTHIAFVNGHVRPADSSGGLLDNSLDLGHSNARWDDVYATNGTIQTSDRNEKQDIAELSDAEQRVAVACKGLLRKFRWKDSVAEKGDDARIHFGIIAQDLQAAFAAEGLDAGDYAMFISSTWTDEETNEEKTRMGVRYSELLAFIIAAI